MVGRGVPPSRKEKEPIERTSEMKKKLMIVVAAVAAAFGAWADTETVGGYIWTYSINGGTPEILI